MELTDALPVNFFDLTQSLDDSPSVACSSPAYKICTKSVMLTEQLFVEHIH